MPSSAETSALPRSVLTDDALPLYGHVASQLLADLQASRARTGDKLPSERALAERYGVSRVTLRAALGELRQRSVVSPSAARGWFVDTVTEAAEAAADPGAPVGPTVQGFADFAAAQGLRVRARVLSVGVRPATVQESVQLRIGPGAPLFELHRLRYLNDMVIVEEHNRLPLELAPYLPDADFATASLYATLREGSPAQTPRVADYSVEARVADERECRLLEITDRTPLLVATQLAYNQDDRPLELTVAAYRGDRYRFTASITNLPRGAIGPTVP